MFTKTKEGVPSYRLHKPSGQAVVTLSGRDHYLGRFGTPESRRGYERLVATWFGNGRRLPETKPARAITVGEVCDAFLTWCEREYRAGDGTLSRAVENVRIALRPLVLGELATLPATEFGPKALLRFRDELVAAALVRKTVNERVGVVKRASRFATRARSAERRSSGSAT
jgi:hypothetical protein